MRPTNQVITSTAYSSGGDFCRIFSERMKDFYLLGYLLTGDGEKAERCFVAGLGDCIKGNAVFKEWAQSWARRMIIQNAIQLITPARKSPAIRLDNAGASAAPVEMPSELEAVLRLEPLERFVFVMSALEGYSYQDCSILLGCSRQQVVDSRQRATLHLAGTAESSFMGSHEAHAGHAAFLLKQKSAVI